MGKVYLGLKPRHIMAAMPQTLSFNLVHIIFSTKNREPLIHDEILANLHAYLAGTVRKLGCECIRAGGVADHVHLAVRLPTTKTAAKVVSEIKTGSSVWMKQQGVLNFAWQRGYGLFSVSPADLGVPVEYIDDQRAHHRKRGFQEEMRAFYAKYHVAFDERFVWD
jgi:putative transposase